MAHICCDVNMFQCVIRYIAAIMEECAMWSIVTSFLSNIILLQDAIMLFDHKRHNAGMTHVHHTNPHGTHNLNKMDSQSDNIQVCQMRVTKIMYVFMHQTKCSLFHTWVTSIMGTDMLIAITCIDLTLNGHMMFWRRASWTLPWRHNDHDGVSNHQPHGCLLNRLFRRRSKKISKLRVTGPLCGEFTGTSEFLAQRASNVENVSIWWRHHECWLQTQNPESLICIWNISLLWI